MNAKTKEVTSIKFLWSLILNSNFIRSKACKKDLWAQITQALQSNPKWCPCCLGIDELLVEIEEESSDFSSLSPHSLHFYRYYQDQAAGVSVRRFDNQRLFPQPHGNFPNMSLPPPPPSTHFIFIPMSFPNWNSH